MLSLLLLHRLVQNLSQKRRDELTITIHRWTTAVVMSVFVTGVIFPSTAIAASSWDSTLIVNTESFQIIDEGDGTTDIEMQFGDNISGKVIYDVGTDTFNINRPTTIGGDITGTGSLTIQNNISGSSLTVSDLAGCEVTYTDANGNLQCSTEDFMDIDEADDRFVNIAGDTMTGGLAIHDADGLATSGAIITEGNITLNSDNAAANAVITFGNDAGAETITFDDSSNYFEISTDTDVNGKLRSDRYLLDLDASIIPVAGGQSVFTTWWALQLVGNQQSAVDYTPSNVGARDDASVIIPNQQASKIGLIVQGDSGQTGNLQVWEDSSGTDLALIDANGTVSGTNLFMNGGMTGGSLSISDLANCDTIDTDANGNFTCGVDSVGSGFDQGQADDRYVLVQGDTMTGALTITGALLTVTATGSFGAVEATYIRDNSLQVWYQANNGSGSDSTHYSRDATLSGGAVAFEDVFYFDGVNDYLVAPVDLNQWLGGTASIAAWIRTTQAGSDTAWNAPGITGVEENGGDNDTFWAFINAAGSISFKGGNASNVNGFTPINDGDWHHFAVVRNSISGTAEIYIDGNFEISGTSDVGVKTSAFYDIGRIPVVNGETAAEYFEGSLDEFKVWDHELNAYEVWKMYSTERKNFGNFNDLRVINDIFASGSIKAQGNLRTNLNLVINEDNTGADAVLTFGNDAGAETITFSDTNNRFDFSDDIFISGAITGSSLGISGLTNCDTIDTDANGNFICGTDADTGAGQMSDAEIADKFVDEAGDTMTGALTVETGDSTSIDVSGIISGSTLHAQDLISGSGDLIISGAITGSSLGISGLTNCNTIDTDANGNFVCGTDEIEQDDLDDRFVNVSGDTMTGALNISFGDSLALNVTGIISGGILHARDQITSSGDLLVSGAITGSSLSISDLANCDTIDTDANGNFICGTDADTGAGQMSDTEIADKFVDEAGDTMTGTLNINETNISLSLSGSMRLDGGIVANWADILGDTMTPGLKVSIYTTGSGEVNTHAQFVERTNSGWSTLALVTTTTSTIDWTTVPYPEVANGFIAEYKGYLFADESGVYNFATDSDDASELMVDGIVVASWYGNHGDCSGCTDNNGSIYLEPGYHSFIYRMHENGGGEDAHAYWQRPSDGGYTIIPAERYFHVVTNSVDGFFSGRVGIGTYNMEAELDVVGTISGSSLFGSDSISTDGNLTINENNDAADAILTFGNDAAAETLRFNDTTNQFEFSDDLEVFGAMSGASLAVSNLQNCESISTDASGNFVCEDVQIFHGYDSTGGVSITTQATLNIDATTRTDPAYSLAADVVTINEDGLYRLTATMTADPVDTTAAQRTDIILIPQDDTSGSFADITGVQCSDYLREQSSVNNGSATCSITWIAAYNNGDQVQLTLTNSKTTTAQTATNESSFYIEKITSHSGADLAELYYTMDEGIGAGSIVSIDPNLDAGVKKTSGPYDNLLLGVISTNPGEILGAGEVPEAGRPVLLALAGRVPVRVSTENGDIKAGDYLTSSSVAGVAMKATKAGKVIGQALEAYDGADEGMILVFLQPTYYAGDAPENHAHSMLEALRKMQQRIHSLESALSRTKKAQAAEPEN